MSGANAFEALARDAQDKAVRYVGAFPSTPATVRKVGPRKSRGRRQTWAERVAAQKRRAEAFPGLDIDAIHRRKP